ncbi:MAG: mandelate racemase/muconate lactonizing enzyme family protein [Pseudomonadota bacterium]
MKITDLRVRPLTLPLREPYHWTQGIRTTFAVNLIELELADGTVGLGEATIAPDQQASAQILHRLAQTLIGEAVFDVAVLRDRILKENYQSLGASTIRACNQMLAGLDFAMWDAMGKLAGSPVTDLLGGAHRRAVGYFFFLQGDTPETLARHAAEGAAQGERVFYLKVGRPDMARDIEIVRAVRAEIGDARLRLDANEGWEPMRAIKMARKLEPFDIEFIEQPTPSYSIDALAHVRASSPIPIVADQAAFTLFDVYDICAKRAADMICIGPREVGGIQNMLKAAAVAEAAGLSICIHSSFTTGITTAAEHQIARLIPNLDDGNQIMWQLARDNIVAAPALAPAQGWLDLPDGPGLGITLDHDTISGLKTP